MVLESRAGRNMWLIADAYVDSSDQHAMASCMAQAADFARRLADRRLGWCDQRVSTRLLVDTLNGR